MCQFSDTFFGENIVHIHLLFYSNKASEFTQVEQIYACGMVEKISALSNLLLLRFIGESVTKSLSKVHASLTRWMRLKELELLQFLHKSLFCVLNSQHFFRQEYAQETQHQTVKKETREIEE